MVYDINSTLRTTVNRHLGNYVDGSKIANSSYRNESLNLSGYTVFLIFSHKDQRLFHAHFVPQADRTKELKHQRYLGNFDFKFLIKFVTTPVITSIYKKPQEIN